jgi:hypothetical protein
LAWVTGYEGWLGGGPWAKALFLNLISFEKGKSLLVVVGEAHQLNLFLNPIKISKMNILLFAEKYLFFVFIFCFITIVGALLRRVSGFRSTLEITHHDLLFDFFLGLVAISTGYSIAKTGFVTVQCLFLVVGGLLLIIGERPRDIQRVNLDRTSVFWVLLSTTVGSIFIFAIFFFFYFSGQAGPGQWENGLFTFNDDQITQANFSYFIALTGQENEFHILNLMDEVYHGASPYHYLELWLNACLAELCGLTHVYCLGLVTFPILFLLSWLGLLALAHRAGLSPAARLLASLVALGIGGIMLRFYHQIPPLQNIDTYAQNLLFSFPKLWIIYGWLMLLLLLGLRNSPASALAISLGLAVATPIGAPAVGVAILGLLGFQLWRAWLPRMTVWWVLAGVLVVLGGQLGFYRWFGNHALAREGTSVSGLTDLLAELTNLELARTRRNIFAGGVIHFTILYLPYGLGLALALGWARFREILVWFYGQGWRVAILPLGLGLGSLIGWMVFYKYLNGVHIFSSIMIPLANTLAILAFLVALKHFRLGKSWRWIPFTCLLTYSWFNFTSAPNLLIDASASYSGHYLKRVQEFLANQKGAVVPGGFLKGTSEYTNIYKQYVTYYYNGPYLPYLRDGAMPVSLTDYDLPPIDRVNKMEYERQQNAVSLGIFFRFVQKQQREGSFTSIGQSQADFARQHQLRYLIVSKWATLSPELKALVRYSFNDSLSGDTFCILQ